MDAAEQIRTRFPYPIARAYAALDLSLIHI